MMKTLWKSRGFVLLATTFLVMAQSVYGQQTENRTTASATPNVTNPSYTPKLDGVIKARIETSTWDGKYRFNVRNARLGLSGLVAPQVNYRMQIDLSNDGKITMLDAYAGYKAKRWTLQLGQQRNLFSTDLARGPGVTSFANRSFLSKFITNYYGTEFSGGKSSDFVRAIGSRDLGAMGTYSMHAGLPLKLYLGLFNGSGINNPMWGNSVNVMGRMEYGESDKGVRAALAYYDGKTPSFNRTNGAGAAVPSSIFRKKIRMIGGELRYTLGRFQIEGEYAQRYLEHPGQDDDLMQSALIHAHYQIPLHSSNTIRYILPVVRWDLGKGIDYLNVQTGKRETTDANRVTAGVNFGLGEKLWKAEMRLNVEKYLFSQKPSDLMVNRLMQDKVTLEFVVNY